MRLTRLLLILFCLSGSAFARPEIKVAVTVDDLPRHRNLPHGKTKVAVAMKMLSIFRKHHVPQVYGFINAKKIDDDPSLNEVLKLWRAEGYPLGNHTYSHKSLNEVSLAEFQKDIEDNESILGKLGGQTDWKYFRYPNLHEGNTLEKRNSVREFLQLRGYKIAQVTVDFEDWSWNDPYARCENKQDQVSLKWLRETYLQTARDQLDRAEIMMQGLFHRSVPQVLLLHIGAFDSEMLDELLTSYEKKRVKFIPLSEAISDEIYSQDPGLPGPWGSELTFQIMKARHLTLKDLGLTPYQGYPGNKLKGICL
jgi:peptidoglycan-N-acetylglucosamine deacetylase